MNSFPYLGCGDIRVYLPDEFGGKFALPSDTDTAFLIRAELRLRYLISINLLMNHWFVISKGKATAKIVHKIMHRMENTDNISKVWPHCNAHYNTFL